MAFPPGKSGNICFWLITLLFLVLIISGGAILVLYITSPEMEDSAWLAVAGIVLIAIPWIFWIMACFYRTFFSMRKPGAVVPTSPVNVKLEGSGDLGQGEIGGGDGDGVGPGRMRFEM